MNILLGSLLIIFTIQILFFLGAALFKTDKVTDLSYGLTFVVLVWVFIFRYQSPTLFHILIAGMVTIWGIRLSGFLFIRIMKTQRDKRFDGVREHFLKFARFWFLQAVAIFIIMLPSILGLSKANGTLSFVSFLGLGIWIVGILIESVADWQKFVFKNKEVNRDKWIDSGLWHFARHPNYFGEMTVWWGLYLFVLPTLGGIEYISIVGPVFITCLLLFVTGIPPLEKTYSRKYKGNMEYQQYRNSTRLLIPLPKILADK